MNLSKFYMYLCLLSFPVYAGGREGSGGGGVACYDKSGNLVSVQTLESWEYLTPESIGFEGAISTAEILTQLQNTFAIYSPIFASRLELVANAIPFENWRKTSSLRMIEDATSVRPIPTQCKFVQLAARYSLSKPGYLPDVNLEYDSFLFDRLSAVDKAILVFHEQMYLIGKETGHNRSDTLRSAIAVFFTRQFYRNLSKVPISEGSQYVQSILGSVFGDYYRFFIEDDQDRPDYIPEGYTQWSRYKSFGKFLMAARERKLNCLLDNDFEKVLEREIKRAIDEKCSFHSINPKILGQFIDDEQAFLFASRWILDRLGVIDNSENFVVWDQQYPDQMSSYQKYEFDRACQHLKSTNYVYFAEVIGKALNYCEAVK